MPREDTSTVSDERQDSDSERAGSLTARGLERELAGLDALELIAPERRTLARLWSAGWPKAAAAALAVFIWQVIVWLEVKPTYVIPPPADVFREIKNQYDEGLLIDAIQITLRRAAYGFGIAVLIGGVIGAVISRVNVLRTAFGAMITGLQTMPSIVWFPFAILLYGPLEEKAITFVVVLGAAPAIANGLIGGSDTIPPILLRAGRVLGAKRLALYRHVVLPASLPSFIGGLKQGWAFAWRSLMAGELLVIIPSQQSLGVRLQNTRDLNDMVGLLAYMIVILLIGIVVDSLVFGAAERKIRRLWGFDGPS